MPLPPLPTSPLYNSFQQAPSVVVQTAARRHQYRPYRTPEPVSTSVLDDLVSNILALEQVPKGYFLPKSIHRGPQARKPRSKKDYVPQQQQQPARTPSPPNSQPEIHVHAPSPTALSRWQSLSSDGSTIRANAAHRPPPITVCSQSDSNTLVDEQPGSSPLLSEANLSSSDEEGRVATPSSEPVTIPLPVSEGRAPQSPHHLISPLDIPVDWNDLRDRWEFSYDDSGVGQLVDLPDFVELSEPMTSPDELEPRSVSDYFPLSLVTPSLMFGDDDNWLARFEVTEGEEVDGDETKARSLTEHDVRPLGVPATTTLYPTIQAEGRRPSAVRKKRHGRLLSLDEQELLLKTVRFSDTLDPLFDYAKFRGRENADCPENVYGAGESFLSFASPISPSSGSRRWTQLDFSTLQIADD